MGKEEEKKEEKEVKEQVYMVKEEKKMKANRKNLSLQKFMDDMMMIGEQSVKPELIKPSSFNYGDLTVTNYLLWLILAELMILNGEKV